VPNYAVGASNKDGYTGTDGSSDSATTMLAKFVNSIGPNNSYAWANIDTSAIGTDTISAATFYWYHVGYSKTKAASYHRRIRVGGTAILDSSATPAAAGWHNQALTSGQLSLINKTGETAILFEVNDPGDPYDRVWTIQTWDYTGHGRACYLAVTHAAAGGPTKFSILR